MSDAELPFAGVAILSRRLRARELSPVDLVEAYLARMRDLGARLGCFAAIAAERARADARSAEDEIAGGRSRGPLHGVPVGLVDVVDTRAIPTALGVAALTSRVPDRDATIVSRLADQGAVLVGKLAVAPLAGALADPALPAPACRNPWDTSRSAGAPSPGAAAAVAAGLVPFAIAVEGAGPSTAAASCGVTALRPTYGVLPRRGAVSGSYTFGALGPVARSAEDCALVLDALAGADPRDPSSVAPPRGVGRLAPELPAGARLGLLEDPASGRADRDALRAAQELFGAAGAILEAAALPELPWEALAAVLAGAEATVVREEHSPASSRSAFGGGGGPPGAVGTAADVIRAARVRGEAQRAIGRLFERHDLLLAPAPRAPASGEVALPDPLGAAVALCGLPVLSLPIGLDGTRPLGARLVAPPLEEARLLSAGAIFQSRSSHHLQRPPLAPAAEVPVAAVTRR